MGWLWQHLSSRHAAASLPGGGGTWLGIHPLWLRAAGWRCPMLIFFSSLVSLAGFPPFAKHMVSLSSFFPGNRDSRGINCFYLFASERLRTRKKVQKQHQCDKSLVIFHCTYVNLTHRMLIHATLASHMAAIGIPTGTSSCMVPHYGRNFPELHH